MPLKLHDLMKKAESKGILPKDPQIDGGQKITRPWQEESILFQKDRPASKSNQKEQQTDNKPTSQEKTNQQQTDNKEVTVVATNRKQSDNKKQIGNKPKAKPKTAQETNRQHISNIPTAEISLSMLVGLQRALVIFIYQECKRARAKETKILTLEHISSIVKTSKGSVKTSLQRIEDKGFIVRTKYKNGRGGWSQYSIPDFIFQELLQHESENNLATNWKETDNNPSTEPTIIPPVVSSSNFINTNTTNSPHNSNTTNGQVDPWNELDITPLSKYGFEKSHIIQVQNHYTRTPPERPLGIDEIQDSINALGFDLDNDICSLRSESKMGAFVQMLKKGDPYSSAQAEKYATFKNKAMNDFLKMKELEIRMKKDHEERLKNIEFEEWYPNLSEEDIKDFSAEAENEFKDFPSKKIREVKIKEGTDKAAKEYFNAIIWPKIKAEKLSEISAQEVVECE